MIHLGGKTVLVTGASRGIGAATALALGRAGADVVVHFNQNRDAAETVIEAIRDGDAGGDGVAVRADLSDAAGARGLWADALAWRGRIDVLVNNAGVFRPVAIDAPDDRWDAVWAETMRVNLTAAADLSRLAVAQFEAQGGGIVVNVASRAAHRGDGPEYWAYAASKAGLVALTKTVARGWASKGVLAYAVAPGFTATDMAADALTTPEQRQAVLDESPMGTMVPPEEIAGVIAFLASGVAPHATGTTVDVNGASYVR